jgi:hypothetical protein
MKEYTLFWLTGQSEIVKGNAPHEAMNSAGYGGGAVRALDFYSEGDKRKEYQWDKEKRTWQSKKLLESLSK